MFRVIIVPDEAADSTEPIGTKPKFRFFNEEGDLYLFKEGRPNTGDDWSEKVLVNLPN